MSMVYENYWKFTARANLNDATKSTGHIAKVVSRVNGDIAATDKDGSGILCTPTNSGNPGTYEFAGVIKFTAGLAITNSDTMLTSVASGYMVGANSGDWMCGYSLEAVNSGSIGKGMFNFINKVRAVNCTDLQL